MVEQIDWYFNKTMFQENLQEKKQQLTINPGEKTKEKTDSK